MIRQSEDVETLAQTVESSDGVTFVPALTGLGAPYWNAEATGLFTGLTRGSKAGHLARAVLEGIAFQNADLLFAMQKDLGKPLKSLNVDGGAAANSLLMQFQADILGVKLRRPESLETTSLGAIFAAGMGSGVWNSLDQVKQAWKLEREFIPQMNDSDRTENLARWHQAVKRVTLK
jgi:glycerol kinase